jgi:hypothetical protein
MMLAIKEITAHCKMADELSWQILIRCRNPQKMDFSFASKMFSKIY